MRFPRLFPIVVFGLLAGAGTARGQQKQALTLEACVDMGLKSSKALNASQMAARAAEARVQVAGTARLPVVKFGATYQRLSEVAPFNIEMPSPGGGTSLVTIFPSIPNTYALDLSVQQPVFTGFQLESRLDAARQEAHAAQQDYAGNRAELVYQIKRAYWGLYQAVAVKKVVDENVGQVQAHLQDVQNLYDQGMTTNNEVLKVQVQLSQVQLLQVQTTHAVDRATLVLDNLIGLPLDTKVELRSGVDDSSRTIGDLKGFLAQAEANRPELKALAFRVKAAKASIRLARSGRLPQVFLTGDYTYARPNSRIVPPQDQFKGTWNAGIAVSVNVWDWGRTNHQTDEARAQLLRAEDALGQAEDGIRLEVRQRYLNLLDAKERISVATQGVQQAEENYRVTDARFKVGMAPNSDLLDAEVALLKAKTDYTKTLVDFELATAGLEKATGQSK